MEELASIHISAFGRFLGNKNVTSKARARQKLGKLNINQFAELSTDVYDELERRNKDTDPFLHPRDSFHPKRNQARQKLSTLPLSRFQELVSDVYCEFTALFPNAYMPQDALKDVNLGKKIETSVPASTDLYSAPSRSNQPSRTKPEKLPTVPINFQSLDNLMADLGGIMSSSIFSDSNNNDTSLAPESGIPKASLGLNGFIAPSISAVPQKAVDSVQVYQSQVNELRGKLRERDNEIQDLLSKIQQNQLVNTENEAFQDKVSLLEQERTEQEKNMEELQRESSSLLSELKTLSAENASLRSAKEKSTSQINELFIQIQDWKTKFEEEAKKRKALETELSDVKRDRDNNRNAAVKVRPSSIMEKLNYSRTNPNIDFEIDDIQGNEALEKTLLEDYYIAVRDLLSEARAQEEPNTNILVAMKNIVYACKTITQDLDEFEQTLDDVTSSPLHNLTILKQYMGQALTYQMGLAKQFAVEPGETVKEAIEEATTALTGIVVDIYRTTEIVIKEALKESMQTLTFNDVPEPPLDSERRDSLSNLKSFLENETDQIVHSIHSLLTILKSPSLDKQALDECISSISIIVTALVETCEELVRSVKGQECDYIFSALEEGQTALVELGGQLKSEPRNKGLKQKIASTAYEIAKVVKRLIEVI